MLILCIVLIQQASLCTVRTCAILLQASSLVAKDEIRAFSDFTKMSDTLLPISIEDDFAFSIFSQLTPDLQQVLGVSDTQGKQLKGFTYSCLETMLMCILCRYIVARCSV